MICENYFFEKWRFYRQIPECGSQEHKVSII